MKKINTVLILDYIGKIMLYPCYSRLGTADLFLALMNNNLDLLIRIKKLIKSISIVRRLTTRNGHLLRRTGT